ncbi:MAG: polyprenyl synthetase family protein [Bdellovibrionales bacterium]
MLNKAWDQSWVEAFKNFGAEHTPLIQKKTQEELDHLIKSELPGLKKLKYAMEYSSAREGKRFRPLLSLLTAQALHKNFDEVFSFAVAVEFVHSYSLIHDDMPAMDNSDVRRGQPTNHKVFGEDFALLAGDALLTEAFHLLSMRYISQPTLALSLIQELAQSSGIQGMVGGQALDLFASKTDVSYPILETLHIMKTGALIRCAIKGSSMICDASKEKAEALKQFGEYVGYAFQVADDLDDYEISKPETTNIVHLLGVSETCDRLKDLTEKSIQALVGFDSFADALRGAALYNWQRIQK